MEVSELSVDDESPGRWQHVTIRNKMNTITTISRRYGLVIRYWSILGICGDS